MAPRKPSVASPGVTASESRAGAATVKEVLPVTPADEALMVAVPRFAALASPDALTVATEVSDEAHVTVVVRSLELPSE